MITSAWIALPKVPVIGKRDFDQKLAMNSFIDQIHWPQTAKEEKNALGDKRRSRPSLNKAP